MMKTGVMKKVLYSPYFISLVMTLVIIAFLPPLFSKYKIRILGTGKTTETKKIIVYNDLNGDGNSEEIHSFISSQKQHALQIYDPDGGIIDQWNLKGTIAGFGERMAFGDYNHDGLKEVFCFSRTNDSILLSVFEPVEKGKFLVKNRFVAGIDEKIKTKDYVVSDLFVKDMNGDSINDFIFVINSNTFTPERKVYIYNIVTGELIHSPQSSTVIDDLKFDDLNGDGTPEITGNTYSCGNFPDTLPTPFSDYSGWLMAYDNRLNYLFEPVEFPGFHIKVMSQPFSSGNKSQILVFVNNTGSQKIPLALYLFDDKGKETKKSKFAGNRKISRYLYMSKTLPAQYFVFDADGQVFKIDRELQSEKTANLGFKIMPKPLAVFDADGDGKDEYIFSITGNRSLAIVRNDFSHPVIFNLPGNDSKASVSSISQIIRKDQPPLLFVQSGNAFARYQYEYNPLYLMQYPVFLGIYLSVLLLVLLIRKLQQLQMKEKLALQNSIAELQLKTINNQLNPHFTFNAFNAIASLLKKKDGETAYNYFLKFSNLVRASLLSADRIARTLEEELATIRDYLDIQQLRLEHRFDYEIKVDEKVDVKTKIPKMILQNYVENAVKHGLKYRNKGGLLNIEIIKEDKILKFTVQDNGIGRKKAAEMESGSTGMGMQIMEHYFDLLNRYNAMKIKQSIVDLYDDSGEPAGTKVIIELPEKINFNLYHGLK